MEKDRREKLKAEARRRLAEEEAARKAAGDAAIPVPLAHPYWGRYYRENTLRERLIQANRSTVLPGQRIGLDLVYFPLGAAPVGREYTVDLEYFRCVSCSDFLPVAPDRSLQCSCGSIAHGPMEVGLPLRTPAGSERVRVLAKAPILHWWQVSRWLGRVWL